MSKKTIICIDDEKIILDSLSRQLYAGLGSDYEIETTESANEALEMIRQFVSEGVSVAVVITDQLMPDMSGDQLLLKVHELSPHTSKIMLTAHGKVETVTNALNKANLYRYFTKPWDSKILVSSVMDACDKYTKEKMMSEKCANMEKLTISLVTALENSNFIFDEGSGNHILRITAYAALLARKYGCNDDFIEKIGIFSSLHDIGKVGLPQSVLKKQGKFTDEEYEVMKQHVKIGAQLLSGINIDKMAINIAQYHHEKWDGTGYLGKLRGNDIPLEARIVTVADVYDALTTHRDYKNSFTEEKVDEIMRGGRGNHFEPKIIDLFMKYKHEFLKIKISHID